MSRASVDKVVSGKWLKFQFEANYPFKRQAESAESAARTSAYDSGTGKHRRYGKVNSVRCRQISIF